MIGREHFAAATLLGMLLTCAAVRAETRDTAAAEALFRAGRAAMIAGDYETGLARFRESLRLEQSPGAVLNLAICEAELGQLTNARRDYRKVIDLVPESDGRARIAARRLEEVEKRLSWLTISVAPDAPKRTSVVLDDVAVGAASLGVALPLDPGRHELTVNAPEHRRRDYLVTLREGERRALSVLAGPREAEPQGPDSSRPATTTRTSPPTAGYVLLGTGAAGLIAAGVTGILLLDRLATVDENCQNKQCNDIGLDAARSGRTLRAAAAVAVSVGVVAGGIGGYLILSNKGDATEVAWRGSF